MLPKKLFQDFLQVSVLRFVARILMGIRGFLVITTLAPKELVEYTIFLLFVAYFSILDFGTLLKLERDLPHYSAINDDIAHREVSQCGWSAYILLSLASAFFFSISVFFTAAKGNHVMASTLAAYFVLDKIYRAVESHARMVLCYKENAIAQIIIAASSLLFMWLFLPRWGILGIFFGFIAGLLLGIFYLMCSKPLQFVWDFRLQPLFRFVKDAIPLASVGYSVEIFHLIPMTILTFKYPKETIGNYVFAFRLFQICLPFLPYLIQEIMKTRMLQEIARQSDDESRVKFLFRPAAVYSIYATVCWLCLYWWGNWFVNRFAVGYKDSVPLFQFFALSLPLLGIAQICSDFLSSRVYGKMFHVFCCWLLGIFLQAVPISLLRVPPYSSSLWVPLWYVSSSAFVYIAINRIMASGNTSLDTPMFMWGALPLFLGLFSATALKKFFGFSPSNVFSNNMLPFIYSLSLYTLLILLFFYIYRRKRYLGAGSRIA